MHRITHIDGPVYDADAEPVMTDHGTIRFTVQGEQHELPTAFVETVEALPDPPIAGTGAAPTARTFTPPAA